MAYWHDEQVVTGTLETIAEEARAAGCKGAGNPGDRRRGKDARPAQASQARIAAPGGLRRAFSPGPSPQELFRLATAGVGSQLLGWAISAGVFEALERPKTVCDLAAQIHASPEALNEVLQTLVALGLVEARPDGYRNLELASLYLRRNSPQSLVPALMYEVEKAATTPLWTVSPPPGRRRTIQTTPRCTITPASRWPVTPRPPCSTASI